MTISYRYLGIAALLVASCSSPKKTLYFNTNEPNDTTVTTVQNLPRPDVQIGPDDIVAINITSVDAFTLKDPVAIFNDGGIPYNISPQVGNQSSTVKGYLVDPEGFVDFPVVGKIKLAGLTPTQAKEKMGKILVEHIKSPVVEVRVLNFKINMLGEITRVGPVLAPNHKINILEALSAAGDIPITGRKDNVTVIRENGGRQEFGTINLNSKKLFTSPYYYLQKNDIVYVEPNRLKRQQTNEFLLFYLPTITALVGTVLSVYGIVQIANNAKK